MTIRSESLRGGCKCSAQLALGCPYPPFAPTINAVAKPTTAQSKASCVMSSSLKMLHVEAVLVNS